AIAWGGPPGMSWRRGHTKRPCADGLPSRRSFYFLPPSRPASTTLSPTTRVDGAADAAPVQSAVKRDDLARTRASCPAAPAFWRTRPRVAFLLPLALRLNRSAHRTTLVEAAR